MYGGVCVCMGKDRGYRETEFPLLINYVFSSKFAKNVCGLDCQLRNMLVKDYVNVTYSIIYICGYVEDEYFFFISTEWRREK